MGHEQLVREIKRTALTRLEDAARTEDDFKNVIKQWNHLDRNRERRERYWEIGRANEEMLHWDKIGENDEKGRLKSWLETVIPRPIEHQWWRQLISGDFIDTIFDCPYKIQELVEDADISALLRGLSENHREVLYYSVVRQYSNVRIADLRKQTDRNIRKTLEFFLKELRNKLATLVREQIEAELPQVTFAKRKFLIRYDKEKAAALDNDENE